MIKAMNGNLFIKEVKETKKVGGLDLISKIDEQDRYKKAEVVYACETTPLSPGDIVLYDGNNGFQYQHDTELLRVLHILDIVGVL